MAATVKKAKKLSKEQRDKVCAVTCEFRLSHPHLSQAHGWEGAETKNFSIVMLIPKDSDMMGYYPTKDGKEGKPVSIKKLLTIAKTFEWGEKENWPEGIESPVRDGDGPDFKDETTGKTKEGYAGHWVIVAKSSEDNKPVVVNKKGQIIPGEAIAAAAYPGCYARAFVMALPWYFGKNKGVRFVLNMVKIVRDGKPLGGRKSVDQVFAPADLGEEYTDADSDTETQEEMSF